MFTFLTVFGLFVVVLVVLAVLCYGGLALVNSVTDKMDEAINGGSLK